MSKLREFIVTIPFTGVATRVIHAESEEEAIDKALDSTFPSLTRDSETDVEIQEWELHRHIIQGNVFYGTQNQIEVDDYGEVEEEGV